MGWESRMSFLPTSKSGSKIFGGIETFVLLATAFAILTIVSPHVFPKPDTDQYVYQYISQQMLAGEIPYRDLWDHKGVLIYLLYALGLLIDVNYGVWLLGYFFLAGTITGFYFLFTDIFKNRTVSFFSSLVILWYLGVVLDGGNSVEFFNMFSQLLVMVACWLFIKKEKPFFVVLVGISAGLSFLLRPNEIAFAVAFALFVTGMKLARGEGVALKKIFLYLALGGLAVLLPTIIWLQMNAALDDFFEIVIRYNLVYAQVQANKFGALILAIERFLGLFIVALSAWIWVIWQHKNLKMGRHQKEFAYFLAVAFPITIYLSLLSGRPYSHYFISWLLILGALLSFFLSIFVPKLTERNRKTGSFLLYLLSGILLVIAYTRVWGSWTPFIQSLITEGRFPSIARSEEPEYFCVEYIKNNTNNDDTLWVWGNALKYNVWAERTSPTRYVYAHPLAVSNYIREEDVLEIISALEAAQPLILDIGKTDPVMFPIASNNYDANLVVLPLIQYIRDNYVPVEGVDSNEWTIWTPK